MSFVALTLLSRNVKVKIHNRASECLKITILLTFEIFRRTRNVPPLTKLSLKRKVLNPNYAKLSSRHAEKFT